MASVALIVHRLRPEAVRVAQETAVWLRERGHDVRMAPEEADELDLRDCACDPEKLAAGLDLAVSLGGDGTMLRTVELVAHEGVPVLGVNIGRLGYLTGLDPAQLTDDRPAILTVDGRELGTMRRGDAITCASAPYAARFVTFEQRDFFKIVKTKFGLSDR